ncbi:MAG TPA: CbiX/SirB N-terminal domain-containing protein [Piscinibacter sp.]|jgi:sirohydrochlorin cobaltochelatase|uniref:sirohydrochlorin chelatase n=1 Tax=Piscinibacter sp. TaxID=1903157 RepID=UPI001B500B0C|nr:CbiX/SirB N-terminal domain-containing protein [Piscinibacter sp.]MBK7529960.1 CbiX/SirB N-terminal domain-containing protein [Piscinibacter sp.]MBP6541847.1 CbiX/SirB N-terminal domain-containing protein [Piscinibacter sp.]HOY34308.1 CbiX/SirB N-terminal domain-containing protein [Piscinibacter sp.]HPG79456.1 CbiX/SirB N-terminal domain-containing protein [Piscinibacter sp.]HPM65998.1 CbiX/SirB N-terminal domain-containing protein [Piscinibacter sp.]
MKRGLLLFAHGARDPRWALPFEDVAARVRRADASVAVELSFLEFMTPGLVDAGHALATQGCTRVEVVPLFLGAGGHVRKDLPALLETLKSAHPQVQWLLRPAVGEDDGVVAAMAAASLRSADTR